MYLLEVRLDALAFRLYSLPAAGCSVWACVALLVAAAAAAAAAAVLGLWGIRCDGSKPNPPPTSTSPPPPQLGSTAGPTEPQTLEAVWMAASATKARFTAHYHPASAESFHVEGEDDDDDDDNEDNDDGVIDVDGLVTAPWNGGWCAEWTAARRRGDLGWYRFQDMTALNGSVVKLWDARDGGLTATAGGGLRRRSQGGEQELKKEII